MAAATKNPDIDTMPSGSPLEVLYEDLYDGMVAASHVEPPTLPANDPDKVPGIMADYTDILTKNSAYLFASSIIKAIDEEASWYEIIKYEDLSNITSENLTQITSAYAVAQALRGVAQLTEGIGDMFNDVHPSSGDPYIEANHNIIGKGSIIGLEGIAAGGIAETEDESGRYFVKTYAELNENDGESKLNIPTSYSVSKIKSDINIEKLEEFSTSKPYVRGDLVRYENHGYRFKSSKVAGDWNSTRVEQLDYDTLANPLVMSDSTINAIFDNVIYNI